MKRIEVLLASALLALVLAVAGCGGDDDDGGGEAKTTETAPAQTAAEEPSGGGGTSTLALAADPSGAFKFGTTELDAKAGSVTLNMENPSEVPHAIAVEGNGVDQEGETVTKGGHSTVTVELKAGKYTFYCPVPGHEEGGMKGTLTVK